MRNRRLQRKEAVVERQQRIAPEGDETASSSMERTVDRGSFGPVGRSAVEVRSRDFATVFWLIP